jgi:hypothetical protein
MSEYIEIVTEVGDTADTLFVYTNLSLTENRAETYASQEAMAEGSPLAQALSAVEGIDYLQLEESDILVQRHPDVEWHAIVEDISAVLKDFFL